MKLICTCGANRIKCVDCMEEDIARLIAHITEADNDYSEACDDAMDVARKLTDARGENEALKAEVGHWKANHADMVSRNAVLMHRPDLKERAPLVVVLYEKVEKAEAERDRLLEALELIGTGSEDKAYPFRCAPAQVLSRMANEAINHKE